MKEDGSDISAGQLQLEVKQCQYTNTSTRQAKSCDYENTSRVISVTNTTLDSPTGRPQICVTFHESVFFSKLSDR